MSSDQSISANIKIPVNSKLNSNPSSSQSKKKKGRIILAGTIGAGKTTVSNQLSRVTKKMVWQEPVDTNPVLKAYYDNPSGNAYPLQNFFLTDRFNSMISAGPGEILDRSLDESYLFAEVNNQEGNMTDVELAIYEDTYLNMYNAVEKLHDTSRDLLVFLDIDYDHVIKRVIKRGREYEQYGEDKVKNKALKKHYQLLIEAYQKMYQNYNRSPKMIVDMNKIDIANSPEQRTQLINDILEAQEKLI